MGGLDTRRSKKMERKIKNEFGRRSLLRAMVECEHVGEDLCVFPLSGEHTVSPLRANISICSDC